MSQPPQATARRGGWWAAVSALLVLAVVGVAVGWLRLTGELEPLLSATPRVEVELPPWESIPLEGEGVPVAKSTRQADGAGQAEGTDAVAGPDGSLPSAEETPSKAAALPDAPEGSPPAAGGAVEPQTKSDKSPTVPAGAEDVERLPTGMTTGTAATADPPAPSGTPAVTQTVEPERAPATVPPAAPKAPDLPPDPDMATTTSATGNDGGPGPDGPERDETEPGTAGSSEAAEPATTVAIAPATEPQPAVAQEEGTPQLAAAAVPGGALPPWQRFARSFSADEERPRIAVIVAELGFSQTATEDAIERLPPEVTLSFSPYSRRLQDWIDAARTAGHEVMLDLPMEPVSYPRDDPGPKALLTSLPATENAARLDWLLNRAQGYIGVIPWMGSRFTTSAEHMRPLLERLGAEGLMFVDARAATDSVGAELASDLGLPRAINDRFLDHEASRVAIDGRLQQIERQARATGFAVAVASPYPVTIERLDQWIETLEGKGLVLAPISALANRQETR